MSTAEKRAAMRAQARKDYPNLTPFDTGEALEPKPWPVGAMEADDDWGKVDFNNDEDATELVIRAYPSATEDDTLVLDVDTMGENAPVQVWVNGELYGPVSHE